MAHTALQEVLAFGGVRSLSALLSGGSVAACGMHWEGFCTARERAAWDLGPELAGLLEASCAAYSGSRYFQGNHLKWFFLLVNESRCDVFPKALSHSTSSYPAVSLVVRTLR